MEAKVMLRAPCWGDSDAMTGAAVPASESVAAVMVGSIMPQAEVAEAVAAEAGGVVF